MLNARATLTLLRLDASIVIFLSIFLPTLTRTGNLAFSARRASPMLFAAICTWIANDLNDRERDRINHPERPLPSGEVTPRTAVVVFFISLATALSTTYLFVEERTAFWYYLVLILALSYGFVVDWLPSVKALYVGAAMTIPILVTARFFTNEPRLLLVSAAVFCFAVGKEACMDLLDRQGDAPSFVRNLSFDAVAQFAFLLLGIGVLILLLASKTIVECLYASCMLLLLIIAGVLWFRRRSYRVAVQLIRTELLVGLFFLL